MKWMKATKPTPKTFDGKASAADSLEERTLVCLAVDSHGQTWVVEEGRGLPYAVALATGDKREIAGCHVYVPGLQYSINLEMCLSEALAWVDALVENGEAPALPYDKLSGDIYAAIVGDVVSTAAALSAAAEAPVKG